MSSFVVEIVSFTASEAYLADPSKLLTGSIDTLNKTPGLVKTYHALQNEDPSLAYFVTVWEDYDNSRAAPVQAAIKPAVANQTEVLAIQFSVDPTKALSAPAVELAFIKLKEGKTKADVATHIDTLVSQDTKTVISAVWGTAVGDETTFLMIVGWESLKAHAEAVQNASEEFLGILKRIRDATDVTVAHAKFSN